MCKDLKHLKSFIRMCKDLKHLRKVCKSLNHLKKRLIGDAHRGPNVGPLLAGTHHIDKFEISYIICSYNYFYLFLHNLSHTMQKTRTGPSHATEKKRKNTALHRQTTSLFAKILRSLCVHTPGSLHARTQQQEPPMFHAAD